MQPSHGARNAASTLPILAHTLPISTNYITTRREHGAKNAAIADERTNERKHEHANTRTREQTNTRTNEQTNKRTNERRWSRVNSNLYIYCII